MHALAIIAALGCTGTAPQDWQGLVDGWRHPDPIPDFELVDHDGTSFRLSRYDEAHVLIGFVYTRCDVATACPLTMARMRAVREAWREAVRAGRTGDHRLELLTLTFDAPHDDPGRLRAFAASHHADWTLATGPESLVNVELPAMFNVLAVPDGAGGLDHTVRLVLLEPGRRDGALWTDNVVSAAEVVARVLEAGPTSAAAPSR